MKVTIKSFDVEMELKNKGIELEIRDTDETFLGDLIVTRTQVIWCPGKTARQNGHSVAIHKFIEWMEENG